MLIKAKRLEIRPLGRMWPWSEPWFSSSGPRDLVVGSQSGMAHVAGPVVVMGWVNGDLMPAPRASTAPGHSVREHKPGL